MSGHQRYSDDDFDRALRELADGTAAEPRFREGSAAERAKAAKQQAKRNRKQARRQRGQRPGRGRGWTRVLTGLIVLVVLGGSGAVLWLKTRHSPAPSAPAAVRSVVPTVSSGLPPANPFATTPARAWADGAAGIVLPAAKPAGQFTAAQTAAAYQTTEKLLIAGYLDRPSLLGGTPAAFADLLASQQRAQFLSGLDKTGLSKAGAPLSTRSWITQFAPGSATLIGNAIKVRGTMSAASAHVSGGTALVVTVNYLFVYAIERPGNPADWMRIVSHVHGQIQFAPWNEVNGQLTPWDLAAAGQAGSFCGSTDGYIHPDYPSVAALPGAHPSPSGPAINPYSFTATLPRGINCGNTTGT